MAKVASESVFGLDQGNVTRATGESKNPCPPNLLVRLSEKF
jgi:hypothetical protein